MEVWVGPEFNGPLPPFKIAGLYVDNLLINEDIPKARSMITRTLNAPDYSIFQFNFTLSTPVRNPRRSARIFKLTNTEILAYIYKVDA